MCSRLIGAPPKEPCDDPLHCDYIGSNNAQLTTPPYNNTSSVTAQISLQTVAGVTSTPCKEPAPLWGDFPSIPSKHCRILSQNVNGLSPANDFADALELGDNAESLEADILCLSETNVDWRHGQTCYKCTSALKRFWNESVISTSSSTERFNTAHQPGGSLTIVGNPWSGRSTATDNDTSLGRWNEITITGRQGRNVILLTAYRSVKHSIATAGPKTVYSQQWHILNRRSHGHLDPRKQFFVDLASRVQSALDKGQGIIIALDANDSLSHHNNDFSNWMRSSGMVDAHVYRHGTTSEPATHARGSHRIDYILASNDLAPYIEAAGILPLMDFHHSDHRALFLDIDLQSYLHGAPHQLHRFGRKCLVSSDPRAVALYRKVLSQAVNTTKIVERVQQLSADILIDGFTDLNATRLETLESEFTTMRLTAEKACKHIKSLPWSPALQQAQQHARFWRTWLAEVRNGTDFSVIRHRLWDEGTKLHIKPTIGVIQSELRRAQRALKEVGMDAKTLRQRHLEARADMVASEGRMDAEKAIRSIIKAEEMRDTHRKLSRIFAPCNKGGLSHLLVPDDDGGHKSIDDPDDIHQRLIQRNKQHFSQAEGTPFTTAPVYSTFGPYGTNGASTALMDGKFDISSISTSEATKSILRMLRRAIPIGEIRSHISPDDMRQGKKRWRETTSVSPSGLHLGHDKAVLRMEPGGDSTPDSPRLSDQVFGLQAFFINVAMEHRYVYKRWKTIVNATIEKIPGRPLIEKLRVIHIIESDLNLTFGILFGRRMMAAAESYKLLGGEQFGSRAEQTSLSPLLAKQCKFTVARLTKMNMTSFDNDAKSCYDRIVMLLASLCAQRLGMPTKACELFLQTLDSTKYYVKTKHGISAGHYSTCHRSRIHGPGQGGRASPAIWAIISCLLMECIQDKSTGLTIVSPDLLEVITFFTNGFVDDVTLWTGNLLRSLRRHEAPHIILQEMIDAAQWWEQLLFATGGKLELSKCFFYLITWTFDEEGVGTLNPLQNTNATVRITDSATGAPIEIAGKDPRETHKTLGIMMSPSGDGKDEFNRIYQKARGMGQIAGSVSLNAQEAQLALNTRVYPALTYGLAVGQLTETQAQKIQSVVVRPIIRSMGYNMCTPLAVVYAPQRIGGIGCKHIFAEQGRLQVSLLLQQIRMHTQTGLLAVAMLKWAQRVAGTAHPILEHTHTRLPHLATEHYLLSLRHFLHVSELGLHMQGINIAQPKRFGDKSIMDVALSQRPKLTPRTIKRINRCRLFLRAESLADIASADGQHICDLAIICDKRARVKTEEPWPYQPKVGFLHRKTWHWFLSSLCQYSGSLRLREPLGHWRTTPTRKAWAMYYDEEAGQTYTYLDQQWRIGYIVERSSSVWRVTLSSIYLTSHEVKTIQRKTPLTYKRISNTMLLASPPHGSNRTWTKSIPASPKTWKAFINTLPESDRDILPHCNEAPSQLPVAPLLTALMDPTASIIVTISGAIAEGKGAYAWNMSCGTLQLWNGHGVARGNPMTQRRANAYGRLAWMSFIRTYATYFDTPILCTILSYSDDKALSRLTPLNHTPSHTWECQEAEFDVILEICCAQNTLLTTASQLQHCRYVKPSTKAARATTAHHFVARAKTWSESAALSALDAIMGTSPTNTIPWPRCSAYLLHHNKPYTSSETYMLRWHWRTLEFKEYLAHRWKLPATVAALLDWEAYGLYRSSLTGGQTLFATKLLIGWLATGSRMEMYGQPDPTCMQCGSREDTDHILRCPVDGGDWDEHLEAFRNFLESINTQPAITQTMSYGFSVWLHFTDVTIEGHRLVQQDYRNCAQTKIGWRYFMRGMLATEWRKRQLNFLRGIKPSTSAKKATQWACKVSQWLVQLARTKWKNRNDLVHAKSDSSSGHVSREASNTTTATRALYAETEGADCTTKEMFQTPLDSMLARPLRSLVAWVKSTRQTVKERETLTRDFVARTHRDVRSYWETRSTTSTEDTDEIPAAQAHIPAVAPQSTTTSATTTTTNTSISHNGRLKHNTLKHPTKHQSIRRPPRQPKVASRPSLVQRTLNFSRRLTGIRQKDPPIRTQGSQDNKSLFQSNMQAWTAERIEREGGGSQAKVGRIRNTLA